MTEEYALKMGVKPCPFCGRYPTIEKSINSGIWLISCGGVDSVKQRIGDLVTECDLFICGGNDLRGTIEDWNKHCKEKTKEIER